MEDESKLCSQTEPRRRIPGQRTRRMRSQRTERFIHSSRMGSMR